MAGTKIITNQLVLNGVVEIDSNGSYAALSGANYTLVAGLPVLNNEMNYIRSATANGDAVQMPYAEVGMSMHVYNDSNYEIALFPAATDTINDQTAGAYVVMPPNSMYIVDCATPGMWTCPNVASGFAGNYSTVSAKDSISAAGTTQGTATALTRTLNRVTNADNTKGVILPASVAGMQITVVNATASKTLNVYPASGDAIEAGAANAAYSLAAPTGGQGGKVAQFFCVTAGLWHLMLSSN
jgi:hypothetical protein